MFIVFCVIAVLAVVLYSLLMAGRWGALLVYVVVNGAITVWLFMQSSAGMSFNDKLTLGLIWLAILFYLFVAAIVAIVRAVVLLREGGGSAEGARRP